MNLTETEFVFRLDRLADLFPGGLTMSTPVSPSSLFGDDVWYLYESGNERMRAYSAGDCTITWVERRGAEVYQPLPESMIDVLRLLALLYLKAPASVVWRSNKATNHPFTVTQFILVLCRFFNALYEKSLLDDGTLPPVRSFADVTTRHLRETIKSLSGGNQKELKRGLIALTSHTLELACGENHVGWTAADVENLSFKPPEERSDYQRVFPNELFRLVSNSATADVVGFLEFIGEQPVSPVAGIIPEPFRSLRNDGPTVFQAYIDFRKRRTDYKREGKTVAYGEGYKKQQYTLAAYGLNGDAVYGYLGRVRDAACSIIALYTGARYTELTGFKAGCLQKLGGMWFLVGTQIKQEDLNKPLDNDRWPAIPAIRDALRCLELFQKLTNNPYLIAGLETAFAGKERPYSLGGLTLALKRYVRLVDTTGAWRDILISPHRCRHTLAHQLARADVGLVFIAHQMKHLHSALKAVPPQVTLMYGGISDLKMERAMAASVHQYELAKALYDPDAPVAGGGAEEFKARRKQYFEGMMAAGKTKEEVIQSLARLGVGLSSVGMGFCSGRRDIRLKDGTTEKPPCIGSLQCTPDSCRNALITKLHEPVWKKVESQNLELAERDDMKHARDELLRKANIAHGVLADLGAH
jgi:hypothetical protein